MPHDQTGERHEALIGHTGFVGSNLREQHRFTDFYNSENVEDIRGREFDLVVSAGAPGVKWLANKEPERDRAAIERLMTNLKDVRARRFILISTLNVYPLPLGVNEDSVIDPSACMPYGRHRYELEQFVSSRFPDHLIVRLPGIFGPGLKKNVLFDMINRNDAFLADAHVDSVVQMYDLKRLWRDFKKAEEHRIPILNMATEPVRLMEISRRLFGRDFPGRTDGPIYHDDMRTKYGPVWGKNIPYLYAAEDVMSDLREFLRSAG